MKQRVPSNMTTSKGDNEHKKNDVSSHASDASLVAIDEIARRKAEQAMKFTPPVGRGE
jgi:hypothetical protein